MQYEVETLDGIDAAVHSLYTKDGDKYRLSVDGLPKGEDVGGLKSKIDELLAEKKDASARAKAAEAAAKAAQEEAARKAGDTDALDKSWREKLAAREAELSESMTRQTKAITAMTVESTAIRMAAELAGDLGTADLLIPHIMRRLAVEERDGMFVAAVRDSHGKPSAATIEELKKEFVANPLFSRVIAGSKASGGGADGKPGLGSANADMMKLPPVERMIAARNAAK